MNETLASSFLGQVVQHKGRAEDAGSSVGNHRDGELQRTAIFGRKGPRRPLKGSLDRRLEQSRAVIPRPAWNSFFFVGRRVEISFFVLKS